jgi:hypothetical protein
MATLLGVAVRHERRLRLRFDTELAPAAFRRASFYRVTNRDGRGASPDVSGVLVVGADLHQVELALASDLVGGALYEVAALDVPASDASTATGTIAVRPGEPTRAPSPVAAEDDADVLLYGVDLFHDGSDYVEAEDGDLATIGGEANLDAALLRRCRRTDSFGTRATAPLRGATWTARPARCRLCAVRSSARRLPMIA